MSRITRKEAEEARNQMPAMLEAAEKGTSTIITRHGHPVAALIPLEQCSAREQQKALLPLTGTGRGLWGKSSTRTIRSLRDEWNRRSVPYYPRQRDSESRLTRAEIERMGHGGRRGKIST